VWVTGGSTLTLIDARISMCTARGSGGAILVEDGSTLVISGSSVIEGSFAQGDGGCVLALDASVDIRDASLFRNCSAAANGGAVSPSLACLRIRLCTLVDVPLQKDAHGFSNMPAHVIQMRAHLQA
jgi:hypothetical protein